MSDEYLEWAKKHPNNSYNDFLEEKEEEEYEKEKTRRIEKKQANLEKLLKEMTGQTIVSVEVVDWGHMEAEYEEYTAPTVEFMFESGLRVRSEYPVKWGDSEQFGSEDDSNVPELEGEKRIVEKK